MSMFETVESIATETICRSTKEQCLKLVHRSPRVTGVVDSGDIEKRSSGTTRGSVQGVPGVVLLWHGVLTPDEFPQRYLNA